MKKDLIVAKKKKKDEFYTSYDDIENELKHYRKHFKGKTVYCNCDDPRASNFFQYFRVNFEWLGLKKLITSCYKNQNPLLFSDHNDERAVYIEYEGDKDGNSRILSDGELEIKEFRGDGAFQNSESVELLKQADIVVTNPPFSLFREYVKQLVDYEKKFIIIGHQNAISYKEIFPYIRDNKIWLGIGFKGGAGHFYSKYEDFATASDRKEGMIRVSGVVWFTNLDHSKRRDRLTLFKEYYGNEGDYPRYDNYDAIEVSKTKHIPADWGGVYGSSDYVFS